MALAATPTPPGHSRVVSNYAAALAGVRIPAAYTFEYSFEHHGERPQARHDRVYRQGERERDEIMSVNGQRLLSPQIRVFSGRRDRYAIARIAPNPDAYAFTYAGVQKNGRHLDYIFDAVARVPSNYTVTQVTIDGETFLPRKVTFRTQSGTTVGTGAVTYGKAEHYWMPLSASARAEVGGKLQTERILWGHYRFYASLPRSTFAQPRPLPSAGP